jgi:hypothetical protein
MCESAEMANVVMVQVLLAKYPSRMSADTPQKPLGLCV